MISAETHRRQHQLMNFSESQRLIETPRIVRRGLGPVLDLLRIGESGTRELEICNNGPFKSFARDWGEKWQGENFLRCLEMLAPALPAPI